MSTRFAVIGAGPGGYAAAFHAADLGMQVTLIDADPNPGGVCTFRGCIPSKALLHAAKVLDEAKHAERVRRVVRQAVDRRRQAARVERSGRQEADRRARTSREVAEGDLHPGARVVREREDAERRNRQRRTEGRGRLHHHRDRIAPDDRAECVDRQPEGARFDDGARAAGRAESSARRRRRVHRAGAWNGVRRARLESDRCRNDRRTAARRRSRSCGRRRQADGDVRAKRFCWRRKSRA